MAIPTTRAELTELVEAPFSKLRAAIEGGGNELAGVRCVENWSVQELLAVRLWWTESVVQWIAAGRRGETPAIPAQGYRWNVTPRLNDDVVAAARGTAARTGHDRRSGRRRTPRGRRLPLGGPVARRTVDLVEPGAPARPRGRSCAGRSGVGCRWDTRERLGRGGDLPLRRVAAAHGVMARWPGIGLPEPRVPSRSWTTAAVLDSGNRVLVTPTLA